MYKASNVSFNPTTLESYSYGYWLFTKVINGKLVFNSYNFSATTGAHQSKVRCLLIDLGIKIDIEIECPRGLHAADMIQSIERQYESLISELQFSIDKPRSQKKKNIERQAQIDAYKNKLNEFKAI